MLTDRSRRRAIATAAGLSLAAVVGGGGAVAGAQPSPAGAQQPKDTRSAVCRYWDSLDDTLGSVSMWRTTLQGDPVLGSMTPGETLTVTAGPGVAFSVAVYAADGTILDNPPLGLGGVYSRTVSVADASIFVGRPHPVSTWSTTCTAAPTKPGNGPKDDHADNGNHGGQNNGHHGDGNNGHGGRNGHR